MNYREIVCQSTGKILKADQIYKIKNNGECIENIVSICKCCPYSNSHLPQCEHCYGTIAQNAIRKINEETGRVKVEFSDYKNTFLKIGDTYLEMMEADEFIENLEIIANLNNSNWSHGKKVSDRLTACLPPSTWKTDCYNCQLKYRNNNELTPCQKAKKYCEEHYIDLETVTQQQLDKLKLPQDCICGEQTQQLIYV